MAWGRALDPSTGELRRTGQAMVIPRRCETWSCFCCVTGVLRRRGQARCFKGQSQPGRVFMVTLTIDPRDRRWIAFRNGELRKEYARLSYHAGNTDWSRRWRTAVTRASIRYVAASWNRMATELRRAPEMRSWLELNPRTGEAVVPFMRTLELQKNGRAHLHVAVRAPSLETGFGKRKFFRELAVRSGFGGDVERGRGMGFDMDAARSRGELARYMTKGVSLAGYMTKASDQMPRHTRRFSYSRSWCDWAPKTRLAGWWDWRLAGGAPETLTRALEASGFEMVDPGRGRVRSAGGLVASPAGGTPC